MAKVYDDEQALVLYNTSNTEVDTYIQFESREAKSVWTSEIQRLLDQQMKFLFSE